ncbi:MAG: bifunctional [glutamate--ammonia ligase]-adenylyl-L-tyrosine phosphorylase/[glutamate--ammonia-ligase] adenylyltransferase [Woeseiaceae bacterium]
MEPAKNPHIDDAIAALPPQLCELVTRQLQKINDLNSPPVVAPEQTATLVRMLACSEYAAGVFLREASWLFDQGDALLQPPCRERLRNFAQEIGQSSEPMEVIQGRIRRFRNRYFLHILWREFAESASLNETLHAISDLADALLQGAAAFAQREVQRRFGAIRDENDDVVELVILGMGKLGGRELNFSSDIDIIFLYPGGSDSDGERSLSPHEYFARVSRTIVTLLEAPTADGFAFRVDTRLRPFGDSGPPVTSFAALESYLVQHGRSWERYAYIKAKIVGPVPPPAVTADLYDNMISPFVYRRYLDYGVFESLREMHALIATEVQRRELADDVKLGPGGIREIEFIVQSLQLVRGGSQPELRSRELQIVLPRLAGHRDIAAEDVAELLRAYAFLRRTENFIQAIRDQQTHKLPADETDKARLALAMGCADWESFRRQLDEHRDIVGQHFEKIAFREQIDDENCELADRLRELWKNSKEAASWVVPLQEEGFAEPEELAAVITGFKKTAAHADVAASQRLEQFVPQLFALLKNVELPGLTLRRTLGVVEKVLRRSAYIALLNENAAALGKLVDLCTRSAYIARQIAQYPVLLDELLNPGGYASAISRASMSAELEERGAELFDDDSEQQTEMLAKFQRSAQFRIAVADFNESLPIMRVSDCLTELAETVLDYALKIAWRDLTEKYGKPGDAGFAIVAYGKFGGLELSYGSDLDLVFLHDSTVANAMTDGPQPLDHTMFFTRLVRRLVHFLTTQTASGVLYEVDTRLRPDGQSGLLVTNTEAFARYQEENAWTWEHQALLRARAVVGRASIAERFRQIRQATLTAGLHEETLRKDVISMRQRMRKKLDSSDEQYFDLKQGVGGIGDIEFLVQYLVLAHAAQYPSVIEFTDNIRQLDALAENNILTTEKARCLQDAYRDYRHCAHHLLLDGKSTRIQQEEFGEHREIVSATWCEHL